MISKSSVTRLLLSGALILSAAQAQAATFIVSLTGNVGDFTSASYDFFGLHFDSYFMPLYGLDSSNAITVAQGDVIQSTVTLDTSYAIPASQIRTDFLQFFSGSGFTGAATGVSGTFNFYDAGNLVSTLGYSSSTSSQLASFGIWFPPDNTGLTFDKFTNDFTIDVLDTPATLDGGSLQYSLVSSAVPEPASWALMITGFGLVGGAMRRRPALATR